MKLNIHNISHPEVFSGLAFLCVKNHDIFYSPVVLKSEVNSLKTHPRFR